MAYPVPEGFDAQIHGYHQQCYQKCTDAISIYKRKFSSAEPAEISNKRPRRSGEFGTTSFPDMHMHDMKIIKSNNSWWKETVSQEDYSNDSLSDTRNAAQLRNDNEFLLLIFQKS